MFREGHVRSMEVNDLAECLLVRAVVRASYRARIVYRVVVAIRRPPSCSELESASPAAYCTCPAGAADVCKHTVASLYFLWDLQQQGKREIPPDRSCISQPAYWMQPDSLRTAQDEDESSSAILWKDLVFVKHKRPPTESTDCVNRQDDAFRSCHSSRRSFQPLPVTFGFLPSASVRNLVADLEVAGASTAMSGLLKSNGCQSLPFRKDSLVFHDHPYISPSSSPSNMRDPVVDYPPTLLSPTPDVTPYHLVSTLELGCDSPSVIALPAPTLHLTEDHDVPLSIATRRALIRKNVCVSENGARLLEERTRAQSECPLWHASRSKRLTASNFGLIMNLRSSTTRDGVVRQILARSRTSDAMRWGKEYEQAALDRYAEHSNVSVRRSGLVVDAKSCWLAASPDGIVSDSREESEGLVEVKCPFKERFGKIDDVLARTTDKFLRRDKLGRIFLYPHHKYFHQVMGQMAICNKAWCDFFVFTITDHFVERIHFSPPVWDGVKTKLNDFYFDHMLPAI